MSVGRNQTEGLDEEKDKPIGQIFRIRKFVANNKNSKSFLLKAEFKIPIQLFWLQQ